MKSQPNLPIVVGAGLWEIQVRFEDRINYEPRILALLERDRRRVPSFDHSSRLVQLILINRLNDVAIVRQMRV
jgi:hypothetical protein